VVATARDAEIREFIDEAIAAIASALRQILDLRVSEHIDPSNLGDDIMKTTSSSDTVSDKTSSERYDALVVEQYEDSSGAEKSTWTRVGVAFPHKDGLGLNVELRAIPVSGRLVLRRHVDKPGD
jgi:hypothetical protein